MATSQTHTTTDPMTKECKTCACPTCSGLDCLCRPRFFAGQLLTDETLNQLDHYIVEKNKLHNRYLHGWGVVCGLEVVCNPCNAVTVRAGYALSPCGDDVIVCQDVPVDVCSLIDQCVGKKRDWECQPFGSGHDVDCREVEGDWILTVRYDEKMTRGITALKGGVASSCGSGCGCGGSSGCGCGGQAKNGNGSSQAKQYATAGASTQKYAHRSIQTGVAAQCEPTLTCEGFVFEVTKLIPEDGDDGTPTGKLIEYGTACIQSLTKSLPKRPTGDAPAKAAMYQYCCSLKQKLRDNLFDHPVYNCRLAEALNFACPDPQQSSTDADYARQVDEVIATVMADVAADYYQYCLCSAFLPPCPEVVCDPRVPLATVTVHKDENGICRIVRVCNLGQRRFLITFPILGYWFSWIVAPLRKAIRKGLEAICCKPFRFNPRNVKRTTEREEAINPTFGSSSRETVQPSPAPTQARGFKAFAGQVWENRSRTVDERTYFLASVNAKSETGNPYLSETELKNPFYTLTVNRVAGPLLAKLPDNSLNTLKGIGSLFSAGTFAKTAKAKSATAKAADPADVADLRTRVTDLQATVDRQSAMIDELRKKVEGPQ